MPQSRRRPKAVQKQKFAARAKQAFNRLLNSDLPAFVKQNPPTLCEQVSTEHELVVLGPSLPMLVLWNKKVEGSEKPAPQASINEFALDEFLNKRIDPSDAIYSAVRDQVRYYFWIALLGDDAAAAHMRREIETAKEVNVEPAVLAGVEG